MVTIHTTGLEFTYEGVEHDLSSTIKSESVESAFADLSLDLEEMLTHMEMDHVRTDFVFAVDEETYEVWIGKRDLPGAEGMQDIITGQLTIIKE